MAFYFFLYNPYTFYLFLISPASASGTTRDSCKGKSILVSFEGRFQECIIEYDTCYRFLKILFVNIKKFLFHSCLAKTFYREQVLYFMICCLYIYRNDYVRFFSCFNVVTLHCFLTLNDTCIPEMNIH